MIHAFALEPRLVATWGRRQEFRFIHDKFGLGTPRALLELPVFSRWKRDVYKAAEELELSQQDMTRLAELFQLFAEHKHRRADSVYEEPPLWLVNAEREYNRKPFAAIVATENPRDHHAVLTGEQIGSRDTSWVCPMGATVARTPEALATALTALLVNCTELHFIDPNFGPENSRHRRMLEALLNVLSTHGAAPKTIRIYCKAKSTLEFFNREATKMAASLPRGISVEFARLEQRPGGQRLHNRYVLTDLGGAFLGEGIDAGKPGETDDVVLLPRAPYETRWKEYVSPGTGFDLVDTPALVRGARPPRRSQGNR